MNSPYAGKPPEAFWKTGVSSRTPHNISDLYRKRFEIRPSTRVATAGSCFAQHISRYLRARKFTVLDCEPAPRALPQQLAQNWGYGVYSARYGNIYLIRQLRQLVEEAYGLFEPKNAIWERKGRFFDALRPSVEPNGLPSPEAVAVHRRSHLGHVRRMFEQAELFIFTLGLTEGWADIESETVFPTAPGTIAGHFDPAVFHFVNFGFEDSMSDFIRLKTLLQSRNPTLRFLLTVSPVPLTATASGCHVLAATTYSKSVLRAIAGDLAQRFPDVDYFPSYELIASPFSKGIYYDANLRTVSERGVKAVMKMFFQEHGFELRENRSAANAPARPEVNAASRRPTSAAGTVICEEELLEAFGK